MFNLISLATTVAPTTTQVTSSFSSIVASLTDIIVSCIPVVAPLFALVVGIKLAPKILRWFHVG